MSWRVPLRDLTPPAFLPWATMSGDFMHLSASLGLYLFLAWQTIANGLCCSTGWLPKPRCLLASPDSARAYKPTSQKFGVPPHPVFNVLFHLSSLRFIVCTIPAVVTPYCYCYCYRWVPRGGTTFSAECQLQRLWQLSAFPFGLHLCPSPPALRLLPF